MASTIQPIRTPKPPRYVFLYARFRAEGHGLLVDHQLPQPFEGQVTIQPKPILDAVLEFLQDGDKPFQPFCFSHELRKNECAGARMKGSVSVSSGIGASQRLRNSLRRDFHSRQACGRLTPPRRGTGDARARRRVRSSFRAHRRHSPNRRPAVSRSDRSVWRAIRHGSQRTGIRRISSRRR